MPSVRRIDDRVHVRLSAFEVLLLREATDELRDALTRAGEPDDVTKRLFPDAYEDARDARAFRELVGDDLRAAKIEAVERVRDALPERGRAAIELAYEDLQQWLVAVTDMRLAIGTKLGVDERIMNNPFAQLNPRIPELGTLHWLGRLQESLVEDAPLYPEEERKA